MKGEAAVRACDLIRNNRKAELLRIEKSEEKNNWICSGYPADWACSDGGGWDQSSGYFNESL